MAAELEEYRCFVGGLAWATDGARLGDAFKEFGDVLESKVINDRETGRSRGFGFVTFRDEKSMKDAIETMNGQDLDGRSITVHQAQQRPSNTGGGYSNRNSASAAPGGGNRYNSDRGYSNERGGYGGDRSGGGGGGGGYGGERTGGYGGDRGGGDRGGGYGGDRGGGRRFGAGAAGGGRSDGRSDVQSWKKEG